MSKKNQRVAELVAAGSENGLNPHYSGYFYCFNQGLFFEAHEVLEALWLLDRPGADGAFYKGLIQLAGAFVHVQKGRPGPATALFGLARGNLSAYPKAHHRLELDRVLNLIESWRNSVLAGEAPARLAGNPPRLVLTAAPDAGP